LIGTWCRQLLCGAVLGHLDNPPSPAQTATPDAQNSLPGFTSRGQRAPGIPAGSAVGFFETAITGALPRRGGLGKIHGAHLTARSWQLRLRNLNIPLRLHPFRVAATTAASSR
ncbi:MAG TPA: hypothetical protein VM709_05315, partial [Candidatus Sulfotelmatobacter sp.]|nr:hypothetical protein [Candidatus Sulfotelmatobacter sp.]